jgi:peptidoglycan L-alanyl-D-glutamate endopeptidase CwlK
MINSRDLNELLPQVKTKVEHFIQLCKDNNIDLLVTSTYRDFESQAALYSQGRTSPGKIVTNAGPGDSYHNWRCAIDVVPLVNGKADWDGSHPVWAEIGRLGKEAGLEWAGEWVHFKELAHFQYSGGLTIAQLKEGATIA